VSQTSISYMYYDFKGITCIVRNGILYMTKPLDTKDLYTTRLYAFIFISTNVL